MAMMKDPVTIIYSECRRAAARSIYATNGVSLSISEFYRLYPYCLFSSN